MTFHFVLL